MLNEDEVIKQVIILELADSILTCVVSKHTCTINTGMQVMSRVSIYAWTYISCNCRHDCPLVSLSSSLFSNSPIVKCMEDLHRPVLMYYICKSRLGTQAQGSKMINHYSSLTSSQNFNLLKLASIASTSQILLSILCVDMM